MELSRFLAALRRFWWIILASIVVAGVTSFFATRATPNTYLARTTIYVGTASNNPNLSTDDITIGRTLSQFYSELVVREPILKATLAALKLDWDWGALRDRVSATPDPQAPLIEIAVVDTDPQRAAVFANEIGRQLIQSSPSGTDEKKTAERAFTSQQMDTLQAKIKKGQDDIRKLDEEIATATSRKQIEDARNRQSALDSQITTWTDTFAKLQTNLATDNPNSLSVLEPATVPSVTVGPKMAQNVALASIVGLVLAVLAILVMELLDDTIKTTDDARRILNLPVLGSVAKFGGGGYSERLISASPEYAKVAEAYRVLRTNLQFSTVKHPLDVLMVTSSKPKEGKSTTAANLATIVAQSGKRVILVDADLRRPVQHVIFELDNERGLSTAFIEENISLDKLLKPVTADSLSVLPSGPTPHNPSELLDSPRMLEILEDLKRRADLVIIDSPPMLSVADATIMATRVDGVLLVVDSGYTRRSIAKRSKELLQNIGAHVVGMVVNRAVVKAESDYYDYDYASDANKAKSKKTKSSVSLKRPSPKRELAAVATKNSNSNGSGSPLKPVRLSKSGGTADGSSSNGNGKSGASENPTG